MTTEPTTPTKSIVVETEALKALQFYADNYTNLMFTGLGSANKRLVLGSKPYECRFCDGTPPKRTFKKRAHAVSELLGNKVMMSLYECDDCNERFSAFERELGNMTLPFRSIGGHWQARHSEIGARNKRVRQQADNGIQGRWLALLA